MVEPDNRAVPPEEAAYQSTVSPLPGVARIVAVPHPVAGDPVGAAGKAFTVTSTVLLVQGPPAQEADVTTQ